MREAFEDRLLNDLSRSGESPREPRTLLVRTDIVVGRGRTEDDAELEPRNRGVAQRIHANPHSVDARALTQRCHGRKDHT